MVMCFATLMICGWGYSSWGYNWGWKDTNLYTYKADSYTYTISQDKMETISINGNWNIKQPVLRGAGHFVYLENGQLVYPTEELQDYTVDTSGTYPVVTVHYSIGEEVHGFTVEYTMYDTHIGVKATMESLTEMKKSSMAFFYRELLTDCDAVEKRTLGRWVFPEGENPDFPYQEFDSMAWIHRLDSMKSIYTFYKGDEANPTHYFEDYSDNSIPVYKNDGEFVTTVEFDLVFTNESDQQKADALAVAASDNMPVSVRFDCDSQGENNVMLYKDNALSFTLSLQNLKNSKVTADVTVDIYDYYGTCVQSMEENVSLRKKGKTDKKISFVADKKGIYYAVIEVSAQGETYKEMYSFGVLPKYEYAYKESNPFGVSGVRIGAYQPNDDTVAIAALLGISNMRIGIGVPEYVEEDYTLLQDYLAKLNDAGVRTHGQFLLLDNWAEPLDALTYRRQLDEALAEVADYLDGCETGNEPNLYAQYYGYSKEAYMSYFNEVHVAAGCDLIHSYGLDYLGAGVYESETAWLEGLDAWGTLDKQDVLVTHAYSFPYAPDLIKNPDIELSFESSMIRTRQFLDKVGDMPWYLNECGLPTTPLETEGISSGADLRTQADFTAREMVLALAYGADEVDVYCLYDQQNLYQTIDPHDMEDNFGMFYQADFYGRIMPKPSALMFANVNGLLDGVESCEEVDVESTAARAFQCNLKDKEDYVLCLWSNAEHLAYDDLDAGVRTPNLPWNNQWSVTETVVLAVPGEEVQVTDLMGNATIVPVKNGEAQIQVGGSPVFVCVTQQ